MHLFKSLKPLTIVPIIRTSRAITTCIIFHNHPIISIGISEIISYTLPFINNSPLFDPISTTSAELISSILSSIYERIL